MESIANEAERDRWNGERGRGWVADADHRDAALAPVSVALLEAASLRRNERVLDVGCGCGATTFAAADAVGPDGVVLGLDLADTMLDVARARLAAQPRPNVTLLQGDAQTAQLPVEAHDIAISRFGTMFFADQRAAFANVAESLRSGGRLCIATWQPLDANPWLLVPLDPLFPGGPPPPPPGPNMFAQSDAERLRSTLQDAGYKDIEVQPRTVVMRLGADAEEAGRYVTSTSVAQARLTELDEQGRTTAMDAVVDSLRSAQSPEGVHLSGGILITTAAVHR